MVKCLFKKSYCLLKVFVQSGAALAGEAVILFERYEQKDKSGSGDPEGNAQIINHKSLLIYMHI
jgi:hypothetical protein